MATDTKKYKKSNAASSVERAGKEFGKITPQALEVEKALLAADLGINPNNDGKSIRLNFPPLTEERRRDLSKQISKMGEDAKVAVRNIRRDANDKVKALKKDSEMTEDEQKISDKNVQDLTDKFIKEIDVITANKEKEIITNKDKEK